MFLISIRSLSHGVPKYVFTSEHSTLNCIYTEVWRANQIAIFNILKLVTGAKKISDDTWPMGGAFEVKFNVSDTQQNTPKEKHKLQPG